MTTDIRDNLCLPDIARPPDKAAAEAAELAATERRKTTARMALTSLLADNAPQAAKDGIAMLRMLVANLVKQPNVPRYRRIATRCVSTLALHCTPGIILPRANVEIVRQRYGNILAGNTAM